VSWMQTFTGKRFDVLNPDPNLIDPIDIANGLAKESRFSGQCRGFYSVAQHSVLMANALRADGYELTVIVSFACQKITLFRMTHPSSDILC